MQVVVLASGLQKAELAMDGAVDIVWVEDEKDFLHYPSAEAFVDLEYFNTPERNNLLTGLLPKVVIVNSVTDTLQATNPAFVRINGWPTFLSSPVIEAACNNEETKAKAETVFSLFQKKLQWLPDEPGFITARVVSMIVNEAYLSLGEGVSTEEEINTAMKLGTAYPYGPFEWAQKIGLQNIATLLQTLSIAQHRYTPAELLVQETNKAI
jgi:3-hydroxybutyryl-CoA dehydrogenase